MTGVNLVVVVVGRVVTDVATDDGTRVVAVCSAEIGSVALMTSPFEPPPHAPAQQSSTSPRTAPRSLRRVASMSNGAIEGVR